LRPYHNRTIWQSYGSVNLRYKARICGTAEFTGAQDWCKASGFGNPRYSRLGSLRYGFANLRSMVPMCIHIWRPGLSMNRGIKIGDCVARGNQRVGGALRLGCATAALRERLLTYTRRQKKLASAQLSGNQ